MDAHLFFDGRPDAPRLIPVGGGTAVVYTQPGPDRGDAANEDAIGVFEIGPDAAVLAVADGVGGHGRGDLASRTALEAVAAALADVDADAGDLRASIMTAIERANAKLVARNPSPATTLVIATVLHGQLRCYTVGDSELMIVGQRGKLKLRTIPHSPVGYARESGMLDEQSALMHDERYLLSNVVGMQGMHVTATTNIRLAARDTVLLGSDGVFDNLYHDEIVALVRAGEPYAVAEALVAIIRERMAGASSNPEIPCKPDDMSFVLFRPTPPSAGTQARAARVEQDLGARADPAKLAAAGPGPEPSA